MIFMEQKHWEIIKTILSPMPYTFCAFGSRVKGTQRQLSDFDLCAMENLEKSDKYKLQEQFEESKLPFTVDLIEWENISTAFQLHIKEDLVIIKKKNVDHLETITVKS